MSVNNFLQLGLDMVHTVFTHLPGNIQSYLSRPLVLKAVALVAAIQLLKGTNRYLSQKAQNNWVQSRPWDPSRELVLLTGGSSGIGKQIMEDLAKLNVKVVIFDIQQPKFALPANVYFYAVDLTSSTAIKKAAISVRQEHGHPTILINNAGVVFGGTILEEPEEKIRLTLEVNGLSHFWMVKEFLPDMVKNDHGHIVTMASMASFVSLSEMSDYCYSKVGLLAFHESLTQEIRHCYGARRVRTSIIHPLWVQTPLIKDLIQNQSRFAQPIMTADKVSQAVLKQLVSGNGGQVVVPASQGSGTILRALPIWLQESLRDRYSQDLLQSKQTEQEPDAE